MPELQEHSGDEDQKLNGSGRKLRGGGVRQRAGAPAAGLPAINHPSSNAVKGARLGVLDGYEVVREEEHGLFGLIARHIEVPKKTWDRHQEWCKEVSDTGRPPFRSIFLLPIVPPYTPLAAMWSGFMTLVDFIYTAYWVPLGVAFCTESFGNLEKRCTSADLLGGCIYTLNMFLGFQFGCIITHDYKKMEVRDGLRVALYYIKYGRFWLDVLAVIPFIYLLIIIGAPNLENDDRRFWIGILSLIRLVRLLRLVSISKVVVMDAMSGKYHDLTAKYLTVMQLYTLLLAYLLSVLINLEACIMLLIATLVGLDNSWLTSLDWEDFTEVSEPYRWYCAIYWVITTSTTTGYGDFTPRNAPEQVFANIYMMLGMMMFGLMVGTIANALTRASAEAATLHRFRKKLSQVSKWLEDHKIPERTQKQVQTYFTEVWVNRDESSLDSEIFSDLPSYLRARVAQYVTTDLVLQMHVLRDQESGLQELVAQHLRPVDVTPGHDVCRQGEEGDRMWICAEGDLLALQHQAEPQYLNAPCMFGESIILADSLPAFRVRPWTVRTMGVVRLWELKLTDLWPIMRMYPQFQEDYLEYVRSMLLTELGFTGAANQEDTWCESVVSISGALLKQSQAVADQAVLELRQARVEDGSLQELLDGLLEFSAIKSNRVTLLAPLQAQQASLQAEQQAFEQELQLQQYYQQVQQQAQQQQQQQQQHQEHQHRQHEEQQHTQQQQRQDEELDNNKSEKPRASPGISPEQSAPESLLAGVADSVPAWADQGIDQPTSPSSATQPPAGEMPPPPHTLQLHQPQQEQQQHQQHHHLQQHHPYHRPPRRRRSWLHHGGFPPNIGEAPDTLSGPHAQEQLPQQHPAGTSGAQLQGVQHHSLHTLPPHLALIPFGPPTGIAGAPPHDPSAPHTHSQLPQPPSCPTCNFTMCPTCGHGCPPFAPLLLQHSGGAGPSTPIQPPAFPGQGAGLSHLPPPNLHPIARNPAWLTQPPVLGMSGQHHSAPGGGSNTLAFAHRPTGGPLASMHGFGTSYDGSAGVSGGSPGATAGSTLLPSLGLRGRAMGTGAGRADRAGSPAWLPQSRSSMPRGIRTMSLANRPGQSRLGADSLPMENFGEGYGIWG